MLSMSTPATNVSAPLALKPEKDSEALGDHHEDQVAGTVDRAGPDLHAARPGRRSPRVARRRNGADEAEPARDGAQLLQRQRRGTRTARAFDGHVGLAATLQIGREPTDAWIRVD